MENQSKVLGRALILGSVFHAIVERTKLSKSVMSYTPEDGLKNTFIELHKLLKHLMAPCLYL